MLPKKVHIKTYGCQMNVYDTQRMHDVLQPFGYAPSDTVEDADLVILNTCHIREKAEEKVYSELGRIRKEKTLKSKRGGNMLIAVGGCVGQAEGAEIFKRAPYVDMVLGPQSYHQLPEMVTKALRGKGGVVELDFPEVTKFDSLPMPASIQRGSAFLSVQEGCDKFCTFCVVPYTRGAEYSRPVKALAEEATRLVELGAVEITLLGQNVNAFHGKNDNGKNATLAELIQRLAQIDGLQRIRYTTSHPRDMDDDLIALHGSEPKLMPFLHLPVQSGSDNILKRMNRKHDAKFYLQVIEKIHKANPEVALSSDFIVGFPGETDKDFNDTMELIRQVKFASAFSFKYSPRPGTPAAVDENQIPEDVKTARLDDLQTLLRQQQLEFNTSTIGQTMEVLMEKNGKFEGQLIGKSPYMQSVYINADKDMIGKLVNIKVTDAFLNSVSGHVV